MEPAHAATLVPPRAPEGWPIARPGMLMGYVGNLLYFVQLDTLTPDDHQYFFDELKRCIDARRDEDRVAVLYVIDDRFRSNMEILRGISEAVASRKEKLRKTSVALAMASTSTVARAVLKTLMTFGRLPYPVKVVESARQGVDFLESQLDGLAGQGCYERLLQRVRAVSPNAPFV